MRSREESTKAQEKRNTLQFASTLRTDSERSESRQKEEDKERKKKEQFEKLQDTMSARSMMHAAGALSPRGGFARPSVSHCVCFVLWHCVHFV